MADATIGAVTIEGVSVSRSGAEGRVAILEPPQKSGSVVQLLGVRGRRIRLNGRILTIANLSTLRGYVGTSQACSIPDPSGAAGGDFNGSAAITRLEWENVGGIMNQYAVSIDLTSEAV